MGQDRAGKGLASPTAPVPQANTTRQMRFLWSGFLPAVSGAQAWMPQGCESCREVPLAGAPPQGATPEASFLCPTCFSLWAPGVSKWHPGP